MKTSYFSFLFILCFSCSPKISELEEFNKVLGEEKAKALDELIVSFQEFLDINYTEGDLGEKTKEFLMDNSNYKFPQWKFEKLSNKRILEKIEQSGLRKELYLYEFENYEAEYNIADLLRNNTNDTSNLEYSEPIEEEIIPITPYSKSIEIDRNENDNMQKFNIRGKFLYSLAKQFPKDTMIVQYVDIKIVAGDISPSLMSGGFLMGEESGLALFPNYGDEKHVSR